MDDGFTDYGSEQFEQAELYSLLRSLNVGDIDPYQVIRTPARERDQQTQHMTLRMAIPLAAKMDELVGQGKRFRNRSEFLRHYAVIGLKIESRLDTISETMRLNLDAVIANMELENAAEQKKAIDTGIAILEKELREADGPKELASLLAQVTHYRTICEFHGYNKRMRDLDDLRSKYDR